MRLNGSTMGVAGVIVATISLVIAISTGAIALPGKNSVDSGDIQKNAVKSKQLAASALKCPPNMRKVGALCYDKQARPGAGSHLESLYTCAELGRELPSWQQLLRVAFTNKYPTGEGELWTATIVDNNALTVSKLAADNIPSLVRPVANDFEFRCVKEATP